MSQKVKLGATLTALGDKVEIETTRVEAVELNEALVEMFNHFTPAQVIKLSKALVQGKKENSSSYKLIKNGLGL